VTTCAQPGCGGTIQDGYCDTCGLAAAAPSGPSASSRSRGRESSRSARGRLGAGLVEIPPVPYRDPASAVLANPQVAENKRYCSGCDQPVGRDREGQPGLAEGFCRNCGTRFSFSPKLEPGEEVAGQYEVEHPNIVRIYNFVQHADRRTGESAGYIVIEPNARALRFGLERSYRALARLTPDEDRRIELVDLANAIRPRTLT
jgi:Protein kinase G rubredoxin domain/Protein kinase G tetratricopeptide repeat